MVENRSLTLTVHEDCIGEIERLVQEHAADVRISRFRPAESVGSVATFPVLDPTIVEAFKDATVILSAGTGALKFLEQLRKMISSSPGKVQAVDNSSHKSV